MTVESPDTNVAAAGPLTPAQAERAANVLLAAAAIGAACYALRTPRARRRAWQGIRGLTGKLPSWFIREVKHAWRETDPGGL